MCLLYKKCWGIQYCIPQQSDLLFFLLLFCIKDNSYIFKVFITDIFDAETADFSSLTDMSGELELQLSQIDHTARITIDEDGYDAAAYTLISADTSSAEPESQPIDFVLDRPFLFVTLSPDGLPMFIGIVSQPNR